MLPTATATVVTIIIIDNAARISLSYPIRYRIYYYYIDIYYTTNIKHNYYYNIPIIEIR